jgi:hypothetical protein
MAQGQGGRRARRTPTGLPRAVNLMVASCHHALPWHKAKGGGARPTPTGLPRAVNLMVARWHAPPRAARPESGSPLPGDKLSHYSNTQLVPTNLWGPQHLKTESLFPGRGAGGEGTHAWRTDPAAHQAQIRNKLRPIWSAVTCHRFPFRCVRPRGEVPNRKMVWHTKK